MAKKPNSEFKIDKGVPVPKPRRPPRKSKYPIAAMKPGDSFLVPGYTFRNVSSMTSYAQKRFGGRYVMRTVDGGVRIWRVE